MNAADIAIAQVPLFAALPGDVRERLGAAARNIALGTGEVAVSEGEVAFDFYAIVRGAADVMRAGERVAGLAAGDVFGELGVVAPAGGAWSRRRNATVVATAPTELLAIDGRAFRRLVQQLPELRDAVEALAAARGR